MFNRANKTHSMIYRIKKFRVALSRFYCGGMAKYIFLFIVLLGLNCYISACSSPPLLPFDQDSTPLALFPISKAGIEDERGRFRDIFCSILETRRDVLPDYQSCEEALTKVGREPQGNDQPVSLGQSQKQLKAVLGVVFPTGSTLRTASQSISSFLVLDSSLSKLMPFRAVLTMRNKFEMPS